MKALKKTTWQKATFMCYTVSLLVLRKFVFNHGRQQEERILQQIIAAKQYNKPKPVVFKKGYICISAPADLQWICSSIDLSFLKQQGVVSKEKTI